MLVDDQRAFLGVCFAKEPREADLAALGAMRERWLLYRTMVRARLREMARAGLPRTAAALGDGAFGAVVDGWLDEAPPRTRYIREIVPELCAFAVPRWEGDATVPRYVPDLARYECARWEVGYRDVVAPAAVADFSFDARPVVNPAITLLHTAWAVHEEPEDGAFREVRTRLCVVRAPDTDRLGWVALGELGDALLREWVKEDRTVTASVKDVAARLGRTVDAAFVETLGGLLAELLGRKILLGSHTERT